jgi:hypothetical protein
MPERISAVTVRKVPLEVPEGYLNIVGSALRAKADEFHGWNVRNPKLGAASGWPQLAKWLDEQADMLMTEAGGGPMTMRRSTDI